MRKLRWLGVFLVVATALCCFAPMGVAQASDVPGPCSWSGSVEVSGVGVEAGTAVSAWINGVMWAETTTGSLPGYAGDEFYISVPVDNLFTNDVVEGGWNGDEVVFKIKRAGDAGEMTALIDGQESAVFYWKCWFPGVRLTVGGVTPGEATLEGQVHLQGREASSGNDWVISLNVTFLQDSTVVRTVNITTDETGAFNITDVIPGTYDIRVKNSHTLSNLKQDVVFQAGNVTTVDFGTLLEGDANDDNAVADFDFFMVVHALYSVPGNANWDERCDFNCNGAVDDMDFFLVVSNSGQWGE